MLNDRTTAQLDEFRIALGDLLSTQSVTHFVTLAFNATVKVDVAQRKLKAFLARVDRYLLGRYWAKMIEDRVFAVALPENMATNTHYHAAFRIAPEHIEQFTAVANELWREVVPTGDIDIKPIWNLDGVVRYMTKQAAWEPVTENMVISTEFHAAVAA